jgi:putative ABC transport system permease protein
VSDFLLLTIVPWGGIALDTLLQDLRYARRALWRSPAFSIAAILTLSLGIGANTSMFSVVNGVLLRRLPFNDPDRVLAISQKMANGSINSFSTPDFLAWKEQGGGVATEMAATSTTSFNLSKDESAPERVSGERISYNLFSVLGVRPVLGRSFAAYEDQPGAPPVVVLSYALWKARFSASPDVPGKLVVLNGVGHTVIGVMPEGFHVYRDNELLWAPLQLVTADTAASSRNVHWLGAITRLASHESLSQAQAQLDAIASRLHRQGPSADIGFGISLQPIREALVGNIRPALLILTACVGCLVLIACANVANLLLARVTARGREISIRMALGAPRKRIVRQVLIESLLVSVFGGVLALFLAFLAIKIFVQLNAPNIPNATTVGIDERTLGYTLLTCIVVAMLFGTIPALVSSKIEVNESLKATAGVSGGFGKHRAAFVITEMALASVLLIGAGLLLKSVWLLRNVDPGFNPDKVSTFRLAPPAQTRDNQVPAFYERVLASVRTLPGVQSAALGRDLPMSGTDPSMPIDLEGLATSVAPGQIVTRFRAVGPRYFHTLQIPVLRGREFTDSDTRPSLPVATISEGLARLYWPNQDAIGKRLRPRFPNAPWYTIVGVVSDVRHWGLDIVVEPTAYYDYVQVPDSLISMVESYMTVAIRNSGDLSDSLSAERNAVALVDKTVAIYDVKTMNAMLSDSGSQRHFDLDLLGTFAGLALVLAGIGVYGVMAYSVSRRTREIGIRVALGASRGDVLRLIVAQGARLAGAGVALGVFGGVLSARWMSSMLYGVRAVDLFTFSVVPIFMFVCMLSACYLPAAAASKVDPLVALRCD